MVVRVRLHTTLRRQTADGLVDHLALDLAEGATVRTAVDTLGIAFDEDTIVPLVNGKIASMDAALTDGDELRLIPAISGGGAGSRNPWSVVGHRPNVRVVPGAIRHPPRPPSARSISGKQARHPSRLCPSARRWTRQMRISLPRIDCKTPIDLSFIERVSQEAVDMVGSDLVYGRVDSGLMVEGRVDCRIEGRKGEARQNGDGMHMAGVRSVAVYSPTLLPRVTAENVFAPVASVIACDDFEEALRQADDTSFGLQAAVFTRGLHRLFRAVRRLNFGGLIVNDSPAFRADHMPHGGNRQSGLGREGVRLAMGEMANLQMVAIRTVGG